MVGTLAGLLAQALLYGPTPVDEAIARVEGLPDELDLDPTLRGSVHTSLAGLLALRGDLDEARRMFRDAAATYEEFGLRFRRATQSFVGAQIELLAGDIEAAERHLRASSAAFDEIGAATSATTHRALLAEVVARRGPSEEAEKLARQVAAEALADDLIAQVLWRCALARVRVGEGAAQEAVELATEARQLLVDAEFPSSRSRRSPWQPRPLPPAATARRPSTCSPKRGRPPTPKAPWQASPSSTPFAQVVR